MRRYMIFLLSLCIISPVFGGTISGSIQGTLTIGNSPYVVTGDLLVNVGDTLRIESGCRLFFDEATTFKIQGVLLAQGTAADSIYFLSNKSPQAPGDWQGIYFDKPTNKSQLAYVVISHASTGITFDDTNSEVKYSCIQYNTNGIDCRGGAQPTIEHNRIEYNGNSGIRVTSSSPRIIANKVYYNALEGFDSAIILNWSSAGLLLQNQIAMNGNSGIDCDNGSNPDIINNTVISNVFGFSLVSSSPRIINNLVSSNQYGICNDNGSPSITYNDVWQNSGGDFWGCPDSVGIKVTVNSRGDSADVFYNIQVAPALANEDALDFTPTSSSPLIDAGDPTNPGQIQIWGDAPDIGAIEYSGSSTPVELSMFRFDGSKLVWSTATEKNNLGFEVQRSITGVSGGFQAIAFVKGQGTKASPTFYSFIDLDAHSGKYYYRLKQIDFNGQFHYSWTVEAVYHQAGSYRLYKNYPNPFNSSTIITFELGQQDIVSYVIYDLNGREVCRLMTQKYFSLGTHQIDWNGRNNRGEQLPSGTYFGQLRTRHFVQINKLLLIK